MMRANLLFRLAVLGVAPAVAFVPAHTTTRRLALLHNRATTPIVSRNMLIDPSLFHDLPHHVNSVRDVFTTLTLSDAMDAVVSSAVSPDASAADAAAAAAAAANNNGWFGFLTGPIEGLLQLIHSSIVAVGLSADAWGVSIVTLTVLIKLVTFPLTKSQLESTNKMQALQPTIKAIQEKYASNQEVMNQKIAETYQVNEVNPLAGCIPSLVQIPVFIGLYRAVFTLARDDKLNEPFLWLPNLEGPTYGADPTHGSDWILQGWNNGVPSLGWEDTIAFMILPLVLVISQYLSMEIMQPKDSPQNQNNFILKLLPLMIGWFSLTVPAALSIYWVTNNLITTATNVIIKNSMAAAPVAVAGGTSTSSSSSQQPSIFAPPRQKPSGFSSAPMFRDEDVKPITAIDAEILKKREEDDDDEEEDDDDDDAVEGSTVTSASSGTGMDAADKKGGTDKKKKRKKRKN